MVEVAFELSKNKPTQSKNTTIIYSSVRVYHWLWKGKSVLHKDKTLRRICKKKCLYIRLFEVPEWVFSKVFFTFLWDKSLNRLIINTSVHMFIFNTNWCISDVLGALTQKRYSPKICLLMIIFKQNRNFVDSMLSFHIHPCWCISEAS